MRGQRYPAHALYRARTSQGPGTVFGVFCRRSRGIRSFRAAAPGCQGHELDRRCSAAPRPARWPDVHMTSLQPPSPKLARPSGPRFHSMAPRRASDFQPAAVAAAGWDPRFGCGETGQRLRKCAKYLQECARDPLRANWCPACNAVGMFPADRRRCRYFATSSCPHLELNEDGASYFTRCSLFLPRWYRVGPAGAAARTLPNPASPEYRTA